MGKGVMFMVFLWLVISLAGNVVQGSTEFVRTSLTVALDDDDTTITVSRTTGFPDAGIVVIEDERIAYSSKTTTTLRGNPARPLVRGAEGTDAAAHIVGKKVSTVPGAMLNSSAAYNVAVMADPSGLLAFVAVPLAFFLLLGSFFFLPIAFLGTDLQILTYIWAVVGIGMLAAIIVSTAGGRRV